MQVKACIKFEMIFQPQNYLNLFNFKNMRYRKIKIYAKYILSVAVILIIISAVFAYLSREKKNSLSVDAMYLLKKEEGEEEINVSAIIYLTNINSVSGNVRIIAYLTEYGREIALYKKEVMVGKLPKDKTTEIEFEMSIENGSYSLQILVFEDNLLKIKGGGWINVYRNSRDEKYGWDISVQDVIFHEIH